MKILVLNCGSSSIKYQLFEMETKTVLAKGGIEKIGLPGAFIKFNAADGSKKVIEQDIPEHTVGVELIFKVLTDPVDGALKSLDELDAVGHRMVHGGEKFAKSVILDEEVLKAFEACNDLAPLHNPANLKGVAAVTALLPEIPQVGVFDTAFHQTMPAKAYMYALPYEDYEKYGIRRYGFHGTSHRYVSQRACEFLGVDPAKTKMITCHIGNGASITAILDGKSVDTSMGLTPTEGLMMGTRVGDVDPGALVYLMERTGIDAQGLQKVINKESGVLGLSGISNDMRDIEAGIEAGNERAKLAMDMYEYRILKYIGAYTAVLDGVDVIVFTGGVGENQCGTRAKICRHLNYLGVTLDEEKNRVRGEEIVISGADSKVKVVVIPTDEEMMIARDTAEIVGEKC